VATGTGGDRDLTVGGADVYNNIGRYLAARGVGAAVISYRLLPEVTWLEQIADVFAAVQWVNLHAKDYGGSGNCVFVMGHSAGAQLAARVALDPDAGGAFLPRICGVIGVSGAAYDLTDDPTYDINDDLDWYAVRFGGTPGWQDSASPMRFLRSGTGRSVPPFLLLYAGGEGRALQRQSQLLHGALLRAGASSSLVVVPGESHSRIVLTLSRDDKTAGPAILNFVRSHTVVEKVGERDNMATARIAGIPIRSTATHFPKGTGFPSRADWIFSRTSVVHGPIGHDATGDTGR
jgi:acetyl esterase/lipase